MGDEFSIFQEKLSKISSKSQKVLKNNFAKSRKEAKLELSAKKSKIAKR